MNDSEKIKHYIDKQIRWKEQLKVLISVFSKTDLAQEFKWNAPMFTLNGELVAGIAGFKNHYSVWFHQGVFLKDTENKLLNAQEGKTKGLRQWRFKEGDTIETEILHKYIKEAIQNAKEGKKIVSSNTKKLHINGLLKDTFKKNKALTEAFKRLTPGKQREYAEYIQDAKREATKEVRIQKITPMILHGKGLNDKYKKS